MVLKQQLQQQQQRIFCYWTWYFLVNITVAEKLAVLDSNLPITTKNISDTLGYRLVCHLFVFTTFWRHLWSITEQTHDNMESVC